MGKIRLKTLGDDELEQQEAVEAKKRRDVKKLKKGEDVNVTADVVAHEAVDAQVESESEAKGAQEVKKATKKEAKSTSSKTAKGKKISEARMKVDASKKYNLSDAVKLVKSLSYVKFDETLELHLKLKETGIKGQVNLPHGTGKDLKVAIADEKLLKSIEAGQIDFDILVTSPSFMSKLVPFARVLGPKGLMPNPKNGTVSENPEEAAKKFKGGNVNYKAEAKAPLMHQAVGKFSFSDEQLVENVNVMLGAVQKKNILSAYLSGTMTPSVQIEL